MARELGLDWRYAHPRDVFDEMRQAMPSIAGITWERLERESAVTYPCEKEGDPGERVVFTENFPTPSGRAQLRPGADHSRRGAARRRLSVRAHHRPPARALAYRQHDAAHRGARRDRARARSRRCNPEDLAALGVAPGGAITVASRRGSSVALRARRRRHAARRVFIPFCYYEAAANLLTNPVLDPFGKIPEFKYCAVRVTAGGTPTVAPGYRESAPAAAD